MSYYPSHHTQPPAFSYLAQPPPFSYPIQITIPGTAQTGVYKKEGEKKGEKREKEKDIDPWEVCGEFARRYAEEENASWKEEVDKLLIFAGLFSGVLAAFALESYHAVKEDPAETTALLLRTVVRQLDNMTNPQPGILIDLNPKANVPQSARWINAFWFLSLALSLSTVMAGILCLQWLREYNRNANIPHREHLAIRYMRYEGMKKWRVFNFLTALPLLLLIALLLFFAGLIAILWEADKGAAIAISILVGIAFLFISITTMLPCLQGLWIVLFPHTQPPQCPYKSPQAWIAYRLVTPLYQLIYNLASKCFRFRRSKNAPDLKLRNWLDYDWILFNHRQAIGTPEAADVGRGLGWIATTFFQYQRLAEAICQCLRDLDYNVVLEAFLAQMDHRRAEAVRQAQQRLCLQLPPHSSEEPAPSKVAYMQDLIISHTLEHLAANVEQGHMSQVLLFQRVDLFLKINGKRWTMDKDIDCPINRVNVALIDQDTRLRILQCICQMLENGVECNPTHTTGAFEIIRLICIEGSNRRLTASPTEKTLDQLLLWISKQLLADKEDAPGGDPEKRLKQGVLFCKLRLVSGTSPHMEIVRKYRAGLDILIKEKFGPQLDAMWEVTARPSSFPYLAKYLAWRGLDY